MFLIGYGVFRSVAEFFREPEDGFMGVLDARYQHGPMAFAPDGCSRHGYAGLGSS